MVHPGVRALAWVWTRLMNDRLRTRIMWCLNAKFAVGVTAIVQNDRGDDWYVVDANGQEQAWNRSPTWELARPLRTLQRWAREQGLAEVPIQGAVVLVQARLAQADRPAAAVVPVDRIATYVDYLRPAEPPPRDRVDRMTALLERHAGLDGPAERSEAPAAQAP